MEESSHLNEYVRMKCDIDLFSEDLVDNHRLFFI